MDNTQFSLNRFLNEHDSLSEELTTVAKSKALNPIREKIAEGLKGIPLPRMFFEKMIRQVSDLLNIDIRTILLSGWENSRELLGYLDEKKYGSEETIFLPLADHRIISEHSPFLEPYINDLPVGEIRFNIFLELSLKGVILKIQNRRIKEISIGSCQGNCTIKHREFVLLEKKNVSFALQETINLGEGYPIGRPDNSPGNAVLFRGNGKENRVAK